MGKQNSQGKRKLALVEIPLPLPSAGQTWSADIFQTPTGGESSCCYIAANPEILACIR